MGLLEPQNQHISPKVGPIEAVAATFQYNVHK